MKTVTDAPYSFNVFLRSDCFKLFADIADMHIQSFGLSHIGFLPGVRKNIFFAEDLPGMAHQKLQDGKFLLGDPGELLFADLYLIIGFVQDQIFIGQPAGACSLPAWRSWTWILASTSGSSKGLVI